MKKAYSPCSLELIPVGPEVIRTSNFDSGSNFDPGTIVGGMDDSGDIL